MGPQCENGYTKIANELLDALCSIRIPGESMQIFLAILRKTYGYGKKEDRISLSQFHEMTMIPKPRIIRCLSKLVEIGVIAKQGNGISSTYGINKLYEEWQPLPKKATLEKLPYKATEIAIQGNDIAIQGNKSCHIGDPQKKKETLQKKLTKEKEMLPICVAWKSYVEMRVKIKKPMTDKAKVLAVMKLEALRKLGHDPEKVLEQSIFNSWQGLFEIKRDDSSRLDDVFGGGR
jgi:phage replication O-like protein O